MQHVKTLASWCLSNINYFHCDCFPVMVGRQILYSYICYSCDVASSKLQCSRTTFNKSLVNFTLISQHRTSSYEKHKEDRREKIKGSLFEHTLKLQHVKTLASWQTPLKNFVHVLLGLNKMITKLLWVIYSCYIG